MTWLAMMYVTLLPGLIAGVLNMAWVTLPFGGRLRSPIDGGKSWRDSRRIFGDNKTWKGFVGMVALGALCNLGWGAICAMNPALAKSNMFVLHLGNVWAINLGIGALIGLAYALFELPNSFLKRRFDVSPGQHVAAVKGALFVLLDQTDSILGMILVVALFAPMSWTFFLVYILVGACTHAVVNVLLYLVRLRKNPL